MKRVLEILSELPEETQRKIVACIPKSEMIGESGLTARGYIALMEAVKKYGPPSWVEIAEESIPLILEAWNDKATHENPMNETPTPQEFHIVTEEVQNVTIDLREEDWWGNATKMCAPFDKRPYAFLRLQSTKDYMTALAKNLGLPLEIQLRDSPVVENDKLRDSPVVENDKLRENHVVENDKLRENHVVKIPGLVQTIEGRNGGSWFQHDLLSECARWCSLEFSIRLNQVIRLRLRGATADHYGKVNPEKVWEAFYRSKSTSMQQQMADALRAIGQLPPLSTQPSMPSVGAKQILATQPANDPVQFWQDVWACLSDGQLTKNVLRCKACEQDYELLLIPDRVIDVFKRHGGERYRDVDRLSLRRVLETQFEWWPGPSSGAHQQRFADRGGANARCWGFKVTPESPEAMLKVCRLLCLPSQPELLDPNNL